MLKIFKINPLFRSIGIVAAVTALAGGITYASLNSNTAALSPNDLTSSTAALGIGAGNGNACDNAGVGPVAGLDTALIPGVPSNPLYFCLSNTGSTPLNVTVGIPQGPLSGSQIPANDVTLTLNCYGGTQVSGTLDQFTGGSALVSLGSGATTDCNAVATLTSNYTGQGGQTVNSFDIDFVGNQ